MEIVFLPPDSSKYLSKDFNNHLNSMLSKVSQKSHETILMGDLNVNFLKQDNKEFKAILSFLLNRRFGGRESL